MTHIPVNFDEAIEPQPLSNGRYTWQITAAKEAETGPNSKNPGSPQLVFTHTCIGSSKEEQNAPQVTQFISLPHSTDEAKSANFKALLLKRYLEAFQIPYSSDGIDTDEIIYHAIGKEASLDTNLSEPDANGNVYNRLVIPRLRGEATNAPGAGRKS